MHKPLLATSPLVLILALSLLPIDASAKPKPGKPGPPKPPAQAPAGSGSPKQELAPYINHLDDLLALHRNVGPQVAPLINQAPSRLTVLKESYNVRQATAEPAAAANLGAAVATCNALIGALDEREKTIAQMRANNQIRGTGDLGRRRKDNFSEGTVGGDLTRTVDVIEQARRERAHVKEMKKRAAQTDNALSAGAINHWTQRSIDLRKQIAIAYAHVG